MDSLAKTIFWDYDMTDARMRELLKSGSPWEKNWVASRILERAPFDKIWSFLSLEDLKRLLPQLQMRKEIKEVWEKALKAWS